MIDCVKKGEYRVIEQGTGGQFSKGDSVLVADVRESFGSCVWEYDDNQQGRSVGGFLDNSCCSEPEEEEPETPSTIEVGDFDPTPAPEVEECGGEDIDYKIPEQKIPSLVEDLEEIETNLPEIEKHVDLEELVFDYEETNEEETEEFSKFDSFKDAYDSLNNIENQTSVEKLILSNLEEAREKEANSNLLTSSSKIDLSKTYLDSDGNVTLDAGYLESFEPWYREMIANVTSDTDKKYLAINFDEEFLVEETTNQLSKGLFLKGNYLFRLLIEINEILQCIVKDIECCFPEYLYDTTVRNSMEWLVDPDNGLISVMREQATTLIRDYIVQEKEKLDTSKSTEENIISLTDKVGADGSFSVGKYIFDGSLLDLLIQPIKDFRDQLISCSNCGKEEVEDGVYGILNSEIDKLLINTSNITINPIVLEKTCGVIRIESDDGESKISKVITLTQAGMEPEPESENYCENNSIIISTAHNLAEKLFIDILYRTMTEEDTFLNEAIANNENRTQMLKRIFGSTEFLNRINYGENEEFIEMLYRAFFSRFPDIEGFDYWLTRMNTPGLAPNSRLELIDFFYEMEENLGFDESKTIYYYKNNNKLELRMLPSYRMIYDYDKRNLFNDAIDNTDFFNKNGLPYNINVGTYEFYLNIKEPEEVIISFLADDVGTFKIDGKTIIEIFEVGEKTKTITLDKGQHIIRMESKDVYDGLADMAAHIKRSSDGLMIWNPWEGMNDDYCNGNELTKIDGVCAIKSLDITAKENYAEKLFIDLLKRTMTDSDDYLDQVIAGNEGRIEMLKRITSSSEFINQINYGSDGTFIEMLYRAFYSRLPDLDGYNKWLDALSNPGTYPNNRLELVEAFFDDDKNVSYDDSNNINYYEDNNKLNIRMLPSLESMTVDQKKLRLTNSKNNQDFYTNNGLEYNITNGDYTFHFSLTKNEKINLNFVCDDKGEAYIDGKLVLTSDSKGVELEWKTYTKTLDAGSHTLRLVGKDVYGDAAYMVATITRNPDGIMIWNPWEGMNPEYCTAIIMEESDTNNCRTSSLNISPLENFVEKLFIDMLCRTMKPTDTFLQYAVNNNLSKLEMCKLMAHSDEFIEKSNKYDKAFLVELLYRAFFNRLPDITGFNYWLNYLKNNPKTTLADKFFESEDFKNGFNSNIIYYYEDNNKLNVRMLPSYEGILDSQKQTLFTTSKTNRNFYTNNGPQYSINNGDYTFYFKVGVEEKVKINFFCDDVGSMYLDGEKILSVSNLNWGRRDFTLTAGAHEIRLEGKDVAHVVGYIIVYITRSSDGTMIWNPWEGMNADYCNEIKPITKTVERRLFNFYSYPYKPEDKPWDKPEILNTDIQESVETDKEVLLDNNQINKLPEPNLGEIVTDNNVDDLTDINNIDNIIIYYFLQILDRAPTEEEINIYKERIINE